MSPPLLGIKGEGHSNDSLMPSRTTEESVLKEHNYFGLSDCSSVDSSNGSSLSEASNEDNINFKATELRLGLPGSQSPERDPELCLLSSTKLDEKPLFPLTPLKDDKIPVSGSKRGFSDTMEKTKTHSEANWMFKSSGHDSNAKTLVAQGKFSTNAGVNAMVNTRPCPNLGAPQAPQKPMQEQPRSKTAAPAAKAQVVGWPPIRSFRKNTLATSPKNTDPLFVKVSMDGAPYLRKVDLRSYTSYQELSSGLEKMFSCFTLGQCGSHGAHGRETMSETKLKDLLHGSEYVLTYEDKDGDWMLVGDVPWQMFTDSCKRLKIMKGSDAIGLAPRAMEKSRSRN